MMYLKNLYKKKLTFTGHKLSFLILLIFICCKHNKSPLILDKTAQQNSTSAAELVKMRIDTLSCSSKIIYCDSCITRQEIIDWETSRGATQIEVDANTSIIVLDGAYQGERRKFLSRHYLYFFYQDTSTAVKEVSRYWVEEYKNPITEKKVYYSFGSLTKYYNESKYLDEFLFSNKNIVKGRKSVFRLDTALIENKIKVYPTKTFSLDSLFDEAICLSKTLNHTNAYTTIDVKPSIRADMYRKGTARYDFCEKYSDFLWRVSLKNPSESDTIQEIWTKKSHFLESEYVREHLITMGYSEDNLWLNHADSVLRPQNIALYHYRFMNNPIPGSPIQRKLKRLTK